MRSNQVNGIVNDLIHLGEDFNPMAYVWIKKKFEVDLITGEKSQVEKDSLTEFYNEKVKWFKGRIKKLNGNLKDFQKAKIIVLGAKEKIEITYKNKDFSGEKIYKLEESNSDKEFFKEMRRQKRENAGLE
jgi:hypothetical protein